MKKISIFIFMLVFSLMCFGQKIKTNFNYLVKEPAGISPKTPVLLLLHGYGSNEADLFGLSESLDSRFLVFSLRAPNSVQGGGFAWYPMEFLADQKFKYDYSKTKESREKILGFIKAACLAYKVDSSQVYLMGFSQGAIISYDLALSYPKKIKGVMALSGRMLEETRGLKTDGAAAAKIKFFIAHGSSDNVIKIVDGEKASEYLKTKKADVTYKTYPAAHTISPQELSDIKVWLTNSVNSNAGTKKKVL